MIDYVATFVYWFAVIDPIGTVPVFLAVTAHLESGEKRKVALLAVLAASIVLLFFIAAGELILDAMGIPLAAFQIAGGIVLFLFALTMIFGESKPDQEVKMATNHKETAIYPLAIPSIAGPGAMLAAVLLTKNSMHSVWEQVQIAGTMLVVLLVVLVLLFAASWIHRMIGTGGASIISRVMGLILASLATANTLSGIKEYFAL
ncbi:MAG: MarC family protein [bacterium]